MSLRHPRRVACAVCLLTLVGCATPPNKPVDNDPLLGGKSLPPVASAPAPGGSPVAAVVLPAPTAPVAPVNLLKDLPPADPRITTAGLAMNSGHDVPDTAPRLEIGSPPKLLPGPGGYPSTPPIPLPPANPNSGGYAGTTLQPPIAIGSTGPAQSDEWQQGIAQITRRGGIYKLQQADGGQTTLLCLIPDQQKVNSFQRFEATSAGNPPLAAMRAVLAQINRDGR